MGLNSYVAREPRPLPIFILADTSGSMRGDKINQLNLAMREMLTALNAADDIRGTFQLCIISFGGEVKVVQVVKGVDPVIDAEAVRVVSASPKWAAGNQAGIPVNVRYTFPVVFKLN